MSCERLVAVVLCDALMVGVFALNYWVWTGLGVSSPFALGIGLVVALNPVPNWAER